MHLSPNRDHRFRITQVSLFLIALALTTFGIVGLATQAKAAPVSITFDHGRLSLGVVLRDREILPATAQFPSNDLPVSQRTDITLNGTETNGALSFPAVTNTGLQFPYMNVLSPSDNTLKVPFTFRLRDPGLTGTYDAATGQTELSGSMDVYVVLGLGALPNPLSPVDTGTPPLGLFGRCKIPNLPVSFSTEAKTPFTAGRFTGGFGLNGSLTTSWDDVPAAVTENVTPEQKALCDQLAGIAYGPGGIWLSNGVLAPEPQPEPVPEPDCSTDVTLCPGSSFFEITRTRITPKKKTVKPGKKVKLKISVTNDGTKEASALKVRIRSSNKLVKAPKSIKINVPAGASASKTIKVKVKRNAKRKATVTATAGGFSGSARLKIRKLPK